ncbi:hypothetical protein SAMN05720606_106215 [Paenibacillus polysaccharolyticus]|uniref:Uncharacterized protein n=1 Tax=Paenibacillus polysaccharolyticus TaxID=582692 RepID=A0A1G5H536_9BACL|nr:hypothetical protein SAMN05720606_106215 [Paenibacillus polysaccharolyticus]
MNMRGENICNGLGKVSWWSEETVELLGGKGKV